jgi:GNAT superfamily N-acetyltransferase
MSDPLHLRELLEPADPAVRRAYRILQRTFPTSELIRAAEFVSALTQRAAGAWHDLIWHAVVGERGSLLDGVATGTYLASLNVGFIGYLAVDPTRRARGVGARLRNTLVELFDGDAWRLLGRQVDAVVGEVEPHNPWLTTLVEKHGAIPLDIPYRQPSLHPAGEEVPLVLYYQPITWPRLALPAREVRLLLEGIWRFGYKIARPFEHPGFQEMVSALDGRAWIGAMELEPSRAAASPP